MPIIVGAPRSGTSLPRMMLDAHPQLSIPPETDFLAAVAAAQQGQSDISRETLFETLTDFPPSEPDWNDFALPKDKFWDALCGISHFSAADGIRSVYRLYAQRFNKSHFGDKTPGYCMHMPHIQHL